MNLYTFSTFRSFEQAQGAGRAASSPLCSCMDDLSRCRQPGAIGAVWVSRKYAQSFKPVRGVARWRRVWRSAL
jgi:hypothetical protein